MKWHTSHDFHQKPGTTANVVTEGGGAGNTAFQKPHAGSDAQQMLT